MVLLAIFSLLLVGSVLGAYSYGGGFGSGDLSYYFDNFLYFLEQNEYLLDALVFLVIFLIISKKVFSGFTDDKALYIVIGIALTIGIIMYEKETGYSFIINSGRFSLFVLLALAAYVLSTAKLEGFRLLFLGIVGFVAQSYFLGAFDFWAYGIPPIIHTLIYIGLIIICAVGVLRLIGWWLPSPRGRGADAKKARERKEWYERFG